MAEVRAQELVREEGFLPEKDGHRVYFMRVGNEAGPSVLHFHGGPGGWSRPDHAARYNPAKRHVVLFDQRGAGKSEPQGACRHNDTAALVRDAERLRVHLGIEAWYVGGSSWGATLALLYAQAYPARVRGLLLGSVFLADRTARDWIAAPHKGAAALFPDVWEATWGTYTTPARGARSSAAYARTLLARMRKGGAAARAAAAAFFNWEGNLFTPLRDTHFRDPDALTEEELAQARVALHYQAHHFFLSEDGALERVKKIRCLPAIIVHGRHDILCPMEGAWRLARALPDAELVVLPTSGHVLTPEGAVARRLAFEWFFAAHKGV